jgi:hypothetical protein
MKGSFSQSPHALEERCNTFVAIQAWPLLNELNWQGWLSNFTEAERHLARCLLEAFLYFGDAHSNALYRAAFHGLSRTIARTADTPSQGADAWRQFLETALITYVEGEEPSATDSGIAFARRARNLFGIPDERILRPAAALRALTQDSSLPVVFVDDFLGSGKQLEWTWRRSYVDGYSFADIAASDRVNIWYIPLLATQYGIERVTPLTTGVAIEPAHLLTQRYSARDDESIVWPPDQQEAGRDFVESVSLRAGYAPHECWGFHELALTVGILDTIPDASLPLLHSTRNGWRPLMRRPVT